MRKLARSLPVTVFLYLVFFMAALPAGARAQASLKEALAHAARRPPAPADGVSIAIAPEEGGSSLIFSLNPDTPLTIASVSKLFSTAAALNGLGSGYQFKTVLYRSGTVEGGLLRGSLLVVGGGDPNISGRFNNDDIDAVFDQWAGGLKASGISRISGDLVLNNSFFDKVYRNPGWPRGQEDHWYQAPVSALSFNDNCVSVFVAPGYRPGARARVHFEPPTTYVQAISSARTVSARRPARIAVARQFGSRIVTVAGHVPLRHYGWSTVIAIDDPPLYFGDVLKERLAQDGIVVEGKIVQADTRPDPTWAVVATTTSDLLPSIAIANKRSQSFYAEQIFKTLAAVKTGEGSWPAAVKLEKGFVASLGLDPAKYQLHDGCGLDPDNRVASEDIVRFLAKMAASPLAPQWIPTLAVSGAMDGSLRHRLRDWLGRGKVHAKTGSLDRVNSFAGYATAASGRTYIFAIVLNGRRVNDGTAHLYEDRLVRALLANG